MQLLKTTCQLKLLILFITIFQIVGCAKPIVTPPSITSTEDLKTLRKINILILDPIISFESVNNIKPMEEAKITEETGTMQSSIMDILQKNMAAKHFRAKSIAETSNKTYIKQICEGLKPHYKSLISAFRSKDSALPILNKLRDESGFEALFISKTLVKIGSYGGALPLITSKVWGSTHSFETKVVAISLTDGKHIWSKGVYVSSMPYQEKLSEAFDLLFNNDNMEAPNNGL